MPDLKQLESEAKAAVQAVEAKVSVYAHVHIGLVAAVAAVAGFILGMIL